MSQETIDLEQVGRSRRRRTLIAIGLVVLLAFWAFWYARSYWVFDGSAKGSAGSSCAWAPAPSAVTVNVLNATSKAGLAATVAEDLRGAGFTIGTVGNASAAKAKGHAATIEHGASGQNGARTLARWVSGAQSTPVERSGATIDLVLGAGFGAVRAAPGPLCP